MSKAIVSAATFALLGTVVMVCPAGAGNLHETLSFTAAGPSTGPHALSGQSGSVDIHVVKGVTHLRFSVSGLSPNAVNSAWLIFDTTKAPFSGSGPTLAATDPVTGTMASVFPSTPATADTSGFTAGNGLDPNGFVTDSKGRAKFRIDIDYDITQPEVAPTVLRPGTTQTVSEMDSLGACVAGGAFTSEEDSTYMRTYDSTLTRPLCQQTNGQLAPKLVRGDVLMFMLVEHFDGLTHGHVSGQPFGSALTSPPGTACGDRAPRFVGNLSDAVPK